MRPIILLLTLLIGGPVWAGFEVWTNADGDQATMRLIEVTGEGDQQIARFELRNGRTFETKITDLSRESAARVRSILSLRPSDSAASGQAGAAPPHSLVTRRGSDPTFEQLLESGALVRGSNRSEGVTGSTLRVDRSQVEVTPYARRRIEPEIRIHTLAHSAIPRQQFGRWTRWYQEHGNTQVFRLFEGETNVRNNRPYSARVEAFSNHSWRAGDGWQEWTGTFTIVRPHPCVIFQVMNQENEWAVHLGMDGEGSVSVNHRRGPRAVIARNMTGRPFDILVRDNGHDFEVHLNGEKVTQGSYNRPAGTTTFRWGLYRGEHPMNHEALILVSGATVRPVRR